METLSLNYFSSTRIMQIFAKCYITPYCIIFQLKFLHQQLDEKNIEIRDIRAQVEKNNEKIHTLKESIGKQHVTVNAEIFKLHVN